MLSLWVYCDLYAWCTSKEMGTCCPTLLCCVLLLVLLLCVGTRICYITYCRLYVSSGYQENDFLIWAKHNESFFFFPNKRYRIICSLHRDSNSDHTRRERWPLNHRDLLGKWSKTTIERTLTKGEVSLYGWPPVLLVWIQPNK